MMLAVLLVLLADEMLMRLMLAGHRSLVGQRFSWLHMAHENDCLSQLEHVIIELLKPQQSPAFQHVSLSLFVEHTATMGW